MFESIILQHQTAFYIFTFLMLVVFMSVGMKIVFRAFEYGECVIAGTVVAFCMFMMIFLYCNSYINKIQNDELFQSVETKMLENRKILHDKAANNETIIYMLDETEFQQLSVEQKKYLKDFIKDDFTFLLENDYVIKADAFGIWVFQKNLLENEVQK